MQRLQAKIKHVQQANTKAAMDMVFDDILIVQTSAFHSQLQIFDNSKSRPVIHEKGESLYYSLMALMFYTNAFRAVVVTGGGGVLRLDCHRATVLSGTVGVWGP